VFQWLDVRKAWDGHVCDDLSLSALLRRRRLKIVFQPPCVVASAVDHRLDNTYRFVRRQYQLARCDVPRGWKWLLTNGAIALSAWIGTAAMLAWGFLSKGTGDGGGCPMHPIAPAIIGVLLYGLGVARSWIRQDLVKTYFPHLCHSLRGPRWFDIWAWPLAVLFNSTALIGSMIGHEVHWRGIRYRWGKDGRIVSIHRENKVDSGQWTVDSKNHSSLTTFPARQKKAG